MTQALTNSPALHVNVEKVSVYWSRYYIISQFSKNGIAHKNKQTHAIRAHNINRHILINTAINIRAIYFPLWVRDLNLKITDYTEQAKGSRNLVLLAKNVCYRYHQTVQLGKLYGRRKNYDFKTNVNLKTMVMNRWKIILETKIRCLLIVSTF